MDYKILQDLLKPSPLLELTFDSDSSSSSSNSSKNSWFFEDECDEPSNKKNRTDTQLTVQLYSDVDFKNRFLITKDTFSQLCDQIVIDRNNIGGMPEIPKEKAVLMTLTYLTRNETFRVIADRFQVSPSACFNCIKLVITLLAEKSDLYITWPDCDEYKKISDSFKTIKGLPNVIGVIGTMHIKVCQIVANQNIYLNDKGYHSVRIQAVVDHQKSFTNVHCEPGSSNTYDTLQKSDLYEKSDNFDKYYLVGNERYQTDWIITPFVNSGRLMMNEKVFNNKILSTHSVVSAAFALLKKRFRKLNKFDNRNIDFVIKCIVVSMILHNICIGYGDGESIGDDEDGNVQDNEEEDITHHYRRNEIFEELYG